MLLPPTAAASGGGVPGGRAATASMTAASAAASQARGSTSVPGGCGARPSARTRPVVAQTTSAFVDWVDESTPRTVASGAMDGVFIRASLARGGTTAPGVGR